MGSRLRALVQLRASPRGIRYVSPAQRHAGEDHAILAARHAPYTRVRKRNAAHRSSDNSDWTPIGR